jgi:hypothetical protein
MSDKPVFTQVNNEGSVVLKFVLEVLHEAEQEVALDDLDVGIIRSCMHIVNREGTNIDKLW